MVHQQQIKNDILTIAASPEPGQPAADEQSVLAGPLRPAELRLRPGQELPGPELWKSVRLPGRNVRRIDDVKCGIFPGKRRTGSRPHDLQISRPSSYHHH